MITVTTDPLTKTNVKNLARRSVGLFGGTFNPVHLGHFIIADQVLHQLHLDEILFIPDNQPPHKTKKTALPASERVAMLAAALEGQKGFALDLTEIQRGGISYTIDTVKSLQQQHPDTDYYVIIGADMVADLPNWHAIDELSHLIKFVGVRRPGVQVSAAYPIIWVDAPLLAISSSQIRHMCACHQSIRYLVPQLVAEYIQEKGLYHD